MACTVGAILDVAVRFGSAIGTSVVSSIESSVEEKHGGPTRYAGRAASFLFLVGFCAVELIAMLVFCLPSKEGATEEHEVVQQGKRGDVEDEFANTSAKGSHNAAR